MLTYTIRRLLVAFPTLLFIGLIIFLLLELAPGDPMSQVPLTVPPEVKEKMREALGLGEPTHIRVLQMAGAIFHHRTAGFSGQHLWHCIRRGQTAGHFLADAQPGHGHCRTAHSANPVGCRHVLYSRHPDRPAHRHNLSLPAIFGV